MATRAFVGVDDEERRESRIHSCYLFTPSAPSVFVQAMDGACSLTRAAPPYSSRSLLLVSILFVVKFIELGLRRSFSCLSFGIGINITNVAQVIVCNACAGTEPG
jgi:hypothetical protein